MNPSPPMPEQDRNLAPGSGEDTRHQRIHALVPVLTYTRMASGSHGFTSACGNTQGAFGWEPERLVADQNFWRTGLHPQDVRVVAQALESLAKRGECTLEYRLRPPDGEYAWFQDTMALRADTGQPAEIVGYLLDISRAKKLELELREELLVARATSQVKSEFLANMSHELTTPLNAVIGFAEVLQDHFFGELTEKQEEYVNTIRESGLRLLFLLTDILQLAKLDSGDTVLDLDPASPAGLMRASLEMFREKALRHNISLNLNLGPDMEPETTLDEVKFRQVLSVLLGNAVKFTPDKGRVSLSGRRVQSSAGDILEISIEDSGPGISADFTPRLSTAFAQEHPQPGAKQGVGLGLALASRLARLQGGEVILAHSSALGSRLVFSLPVRADEPGVAETVSKQPPGKNPKRTPGA